MNMKRLSIALIISSLLTTNAVVARETNISMDNCSIKLNHDLSISEQHIRVLDNDQTIIDIYNDELVFYRGEKIDLNSKQQRLISDYSYNLRNSTDEFLSITADALDLASEGVNMAFSKLGNRDIDIGIKDLKDDILDKYVKNNGELLLTKGNVSISSDDGQAYEKAIEEAVEDAIPSIIGAVLYNVGAAMMTGDTEFEELENLGEEIEQQIEHKAQKLEQRADYLCEQLKQVDAIEQELVRSDKRFEYLDVINLNN